MYCYKWSWLTVADLDLGRYAHLIASIYSTCYKMCYSNGGRCLFVCCPLRQPDVVSLCSLNVTRHTVCFNYFNKLLVLFLSTHVFVFCPNLWKMQLNAGVHTSSCLRRHYIIHVCHKMPDYPSKDRKRSKK